MTPPLLARALTIARLAAGWGGKELATAAKVSPSTISLYESGRTALSRERFKELVALMRPEPDFASRSILAATIMNPECVVAGLPPGFTEREAQIIGKAATIAGLETLDLVQAGLTKAVWNERAAKDRERAAALWTRLKKYSVEERRILVEGATDYHEWALSVLLCRESVRAAANDPTDALALAELALLVAEHLPGQERWRFRLMGQAWLVIGNARRVGNDLASANQAFTRGWQFWGTGEDRHGVLDEGHLIDLEASLRREERRFKEALELHDRASRIAKPEARGAILLNKAFTLKEYGEYDQSIAVLLSAREVIEREEEPRLLTVLLFNLAASYLQLERIVEARPIVREVRLRTERSGQSLDFIRGLWLEGRLAAFEGDAGKATTIFGQVRLEFRERQLPYDYALATFDLALVHLDQGAFRVVQRLTSEVLAIFEEYGIDRDARAALLLFKEAAAKEEVTVSSVQDLQAYLRQAASRPDLPYVG